MSFHYLLQHFTFLSLPPFKLIINIYALITVTPFTGSAKQISSACTSKTEAQMLSVSQSQYGSWDKAVSQSLYTMSS